MLRQAPASNPLVGCCISTISLNQQGYYKGQKQPHNGSNYCDRDAERDVKEDTKNEIANLLSKPLLQILTIQGSNMLMGHVGKENWDAAKLLCDELCLVLQQKHKKEMHV